MSFRKPFVPLAIAGVALSLIVLAGCGGGGGGGGYSKSGPVSPTVVTPTVGTDIVTLPASTVNAKRNVEFDVKFDQGTASYMAYVWNDAIQVRASVCVPCRSRSFTLNGNNLVCNACGTVYSAQTGKGLSGVPACQNYPKAGVPFTTDASGIITMKRADLLTAFEDTLAPGLP